MAWQAQRRIGTAIQWPQEQQWHEQAPGLTEVPGSAFATCMCMISKRLHFDTRLTWPGCAIKNMQFAVPLAPNEYGGHVCRI